MMHDFKTDSLLVRYVLGEASPEECSGLEDNYFADADLFEELVAAENDLVDAYARGQLADADRRKFEKHFLVTPERRQRVEFAKALLGHIAPEAGEIQQEKTNSLTSRPPLAALNRWSAAQLATLVFLAAIVAWSVLMTIQNFRLQKEVARLQTEIGRLQEIQRTLQQQMQTFEASISGREGGGQIQEKANPSVAILTLNPGIPRGNGPDNSIAISSEIRSVRLQLVVEDHGYTKFNATVETANGSEVWQAQNLIVQTRRETKVNLTLPAKVLADGDYIVNLTTVGSNGRTESINSYVFRVIRR